MDSCRNCTDGDSSCDSFDLSDFTGRNGFSSVIDDLTIKYSYSSVCSSVGEATLCSKANRDGNDFFVILDFKLA